MTKKDRTKIRSFKDLEVYQRTYKASVEIMKKVVPMLPDTEKYDLKDQLSRSCKAIPRLIAEGYAKRHQNKGFQKLLKYLKTKTITSTKGFFTGIPVNDCRELIPYFNQNSISKGKVDKLHIRFKGIDYVY